MENEKILLGVALVGGAALLLKPKNKVTVSSVGKIEDSENPYQRFFDIREQINDDSVIVNELFKYMRSSQLNDFSKHLESSYYLDDSIE